MDGFIRVYSHWIGFRSAWDAFSLHEIGLSSFPGECTGL